MSPSKPEDAQLYRTLGQMEAKIDSIKETVDADSTRLDDIDARVTKLDAAHAKYLGMAAGVGVAVGFIAPFITRFFTQ